eukprot:ctg_1835.g527
MSPASTHSPLVLHPLQHPYSPSHTISGVHLHRGGVRRYARGAPGAQPATHAIAVGAAAVARGGRAADGRGRRGAVRGHAAHLLNRCRRGAALCTTDAAAVRTGQAAAAGGPARCRSADRLHRAEHSVGAVAAHASAGVPVLYYIGPQEWVWARMLSLPVGGVSTGGGVLSTTTAGGGGGGGETTAERRALGDRYTTAADAGGVRRPSHCGHGDADHPRRCSSSARLQQRPPGIRRDADGGVARTGAAHHLAGDDRGGRAVASHIARRRRASAGALLVARIAAGIQVTRAAAAAETPYCHGIRKITLPFPNRIVRYPLPRVAVGSGHVGAGRGRRGHVQIGHGELGGRRAWCAAGGVIPRIRCLRLAHSSGAAGTAAVRVRGEHCAHAGGGGARAAPGAGHPATTVRRRARPAEECGWAGRAHAASIPRASAAGVADTRGHRYARAFGCRARRALFMAHAARRAHGCRSDIVAPGIGAIENVDGIRSLPRCISSKSSYPSCPRASRRGPAPATCPDVPPRAAPPTHSRSASRRQRAPPDRRWRRCARYGIAIGGAAAQPVPAPQSGPGVRRVSVQAHLGGPVRKCHHGGFVVDG